MVVNNLQLIDVYCMCLVDFQKIAAVIREFQLKLGEDIECAEVRDALNFALLQLQRYFRKLRSHAHYHHHPQQQQQHGESIFTAQSLHGVSPMTPFRDAPGQFLWCWVDAQANTSSSSVRTSLTLPAQLDREAILVPAVIRAARNSDNSSLIKLMEHGNLLWLLPFCSNNNYHIRCIFDFSGFLRSRTCWAQHSVCF